MKNWKNKFFMIGEVIAWYLVILLVAALAFTVLTGCTPPLNLLRPVDAGMPEMRFSYWKGAEWHEVYGHGGDFFRKGEEYRLRVMLNKEAGRCEMRLLDGERDVVRDCTGRSIEEFYLGEHDEKPRQLGIIVVTEKLGSFKGFFHPRRFTGRDQHDVDYLCPVMSSGTQLGCSRPSGFPLRLTVRFKEAGRALFAVQCEGEAMKEQVLDVAADQAVEYTVESDKAAYCGAVIASKGVEERETFLNVRFYDARYIALPRPILEDGELCLSDDVRAYKDPHGEDKSRPWSRCVRAKERGEYIFWDSIGRIQAVEVR